MKKNKSIFSKKYNILNFLVLNVFFSLIILLLLNFFRFIELELFINTGYFVYVFSFLIFLLFFLFFQKEKKKEIFEKYFKYFFLTGLFLIAFTNLEFAFIKNIQFFNLLIQAFKLIENYLIVFTIFCGFFTFYFNREQVEKNIKEEKKEELQEEEKRGKEFEQRFKLINKIPLLRGVLKWIYQLGGIYFLILLSILVAFVLIRTSSFDQSWERTANYDKIRSEIPATINAYKNNDFFHHENNFYATVENHQTSNYSRLPAYHLVLYPLMELSEDISFFILVKFVMLLVDLFILFALYLFCKCIFDKKFALLILLFLAINHFCQLHFVTPVEDRFALLFFLLGGYFLMTKKYYASYLLAGLAFLAKESFLIIILPFYIIIEYYQIKQNFEKTINRLLVNIPTMLAPYLLFQLLLKEVPSQTTGMRLISFLIALSILTLLYFANRKGYILKKINKRNVKIIISILAIATLPLVYLFYPKISFLAEHHLTNLQLLFNFPMYSILIRQFADFFNPFIWIFIVLGLVLILRKPYTNKYLLAFFVVTLTYLILASKVIAFHQYYRHIFVLFFILLIALVFQYTYHTFSKKKLFSFFLIAIIITIAFSNYKLTHSHLEGIRSREEIYGIEKAGTYLRRNINEETNLLYDDYQVYSVTIVNSFHNPCQFNTEKVREVIKEKGFSETLRSYNCKYFVSIGESDFSSFLPYFTEMSITESPPRTEIISYRTSQEFLKNHPYTTGFDQRANLNKTIKLVDTDQAIQDFNPSQYFELKTIIGDIYIYKLK